jgi:hypothetical protein
MSFRLIVKPSAEKQLERFAGQAATADDRTSGTD